MPTPTPSTIPLHGWTPVPLSSSALLLSKPHLHPPTPLLTHDIPFPSSDPLVLRVQAYAKSQLPLQTYNHSMRVYHWATTILTQQFPSPPFSLLSPSTLALTSLLHDIGTAPSFLSTTQLSFEFAGALVARDLLLHPHPPSPHQNTPSPSTNPPPPPQSDDTPLATQSQTEAVLEAIIRHQDIGDKGTITFLGQLIQLATLYDNVGGNPGLIHEVTKVDVNRAFPRGGWSGCFAATVRDEMRLKPWAHSTHLGEREFPEGVEGNELMREFDAWE
ncbi:hypothetical protein QBC39DRAFT_380100 [Podospora conica]|nr:hypothetical protein QBC39DRAFT_380100 [Schizothecium conicum]